MAGLLDLEQDDPLNYGLLSAAQGLLTPPSRGGGLGAAFGGFGNAVSRERQLNQMAELRKLQIEAQRKQMRDPQPISVAGGYIDPKTGQFVRTELPKESAEDKDLALIRTLYPDPSDPRRIAAESALVNRRTTHPPFSPGIGAVIQEPDRQVVLDKYGRAVNQFGGKGPTPAQIKALGEAKNEAEKLQMMDEQIKMADEILKTGKPTASGAGKLIDVATSFMGIETDKDKASAQLELIGAWMSANVPRFEGPQGVKDVILYQQMAADVGNRGKTIESRRGTLEKLKQLRRKAAVPAAEPGEPAAPAPAETTTRKRYNPSTGEFE